MYNALEVNYTRIVFGFKVELGIVHSHSAKKIASIA